MKTPARILIALLSIAALAGCGFQTVQHSTTESRYMSQTEQEFWTDVKGRQDKAAQWDAELARQSAVRMTRNLSGL